MYRLLISLLFIVIFSFSVNCYARQGSGGGGDDLKGVCELAGGSWTGSESGNWACCWTDWGCYGCYNWVCKMQCRTASCRKANQMSKPSAGTKAVKDLAPAGSLAPIVPKKPRKLMHQ